MRRLSDRGELRLARVSIAAIAAACSITPFTAFAQTVSSPQFPPALANPNAPLPSIKIGKSFITALDRTRKAYRDPVDNALCVAPELVNVALGTTYSVDSRAGKVYFYNNETGSSVSVAVRTPPSESESKGVFIPLVEVAEGLGGKCQCDPKTNILFVRSVLQSVEMLGSQLRVKGTLPLIPKITRMEDGKIVAFDFPGAEIGSLSRVLENLGPNVVKARTGQFDDNTARVVIELSDPKPFAWLASPQPSTLAVLSSAPGAEALAAQSAQTDSTEGNAEPTINVAPPVTVTMGPNGAPLPPAAPAKPATPKTGKPAVPTLLKGVRFVNVSDTQARIVVDASSAPAVRTMLTKSRLTLDIVNGIFGGNPQDSLSMAQHPLLQGVQAVNTSATTAQLLIDLSRAVNFTVRLDPKGGFTIDLTLPRGAGGRIAGKLIIVDAGHGGHDSGARGVNGSREKDVTLAIARLVANELRDRGANIIMTRDTDQFVELGERSNISNRANADLFVAVHADSAGSSANGSTVYYHLNDASERTLAQCVADRFREMGGIRTYGSRSDGAIYSSGFSVLRRTKTLAILCECGYMSNSRDVALLNTPSMQAKIARSIASGIQDYIEGNSSRRTAAQSVPVAAPVETQISALGTPDTANTPDDEDNARISIPPSDPPKR